MDTSAGSYWATNVPFGDVPTGSTLLLPALETVVPPPIEIEVPFSTIELLLIRMRDPAPTLFIPNWFPKMVELDTVILPFPADVKTALPAVMLEMVERSIEANVLLALVSTPLDPVAKRPVLLTSPTAPPAPPRRIPLPVWVILVSVTYSCTRPLAELETMPLPVWAAMKHL